VGALVSFSAWSKWVPREAERTQHEINEQVFALMLAERWPAVEQLCAGVCQLNVSQGTETVARVNRWLALKRQQKDEFRESVAEWDVSALAPRFAVARADLLDDLDYVFESLPRLVEAGELQLRDITLWPLLREAREDDRYDDLLRRITGKGRSAI